MIEVFTLNKNNRIELTKEELKDLLDKAYWEGYRNNTCVYTTPYYTYATPFSTYCCDSSVTIGDTTTINNIKKGSNL